MAMMYVRDPDTGEFVPVIGGGSSVEVDATLSVSGKAADAKATGDALNKLANETSSALLKLYNDKLSAAALTPAINMALEQAKESGQFDGEKGDKGDKGDTPEKGTDYWTAADRQEIVTDVLAALPTWEGGSY